MGETDNKKNEIIEMLIFGNDKKSYMNIPDMFPVEILTSGIYIEVNPESVRIQDIIIPYKDMCKIDGNLFDSVYSIIYDNNQHIKNMIESKKEYITNPKSRRKDMLIAILIRIIVTIYLIISLSEINSRIYSFIGMTIVLSLGISTNIKTNRPFGKLLHTTKAMIYGRNVCIIGFVTGMVINLLT